MKDSLFLVRENNKTTILGNVSTSGNSDLFLKTSGLFPLILLESIKQITNDDYSDETADQEISAGIQIDFEILNNGDSIGIGVATNIEKEDAILMLVETIEDFLYGNKTLVEFPIK